MPGEFGGCFAAEFGMRIPMKPAGRTRPVGLHKLAVHDLIRSREAIQFLVETAQSLETLLTQIPALGLSKTPLLRFRLS